MTILKNLFAAPLLRFKKKWGHFNYIQKFKKIVLAKTPDIQLVYFLINYNDGDKSSLKTLCEANYSNAKINYLFFIPEQYKTNIELDLPFLLQHKCFYYKTLPDFAEVLKNYIHGKGLVVFTSSHMVFHPQWYNKMKEVAQSSFRCEKQIQIAGFSSYNPNDYKLLKTLNENKAMGYCIKNGFSFHAVAFPHFVIKSFLKKSAEAFSEKDFFDYFRTQNMGFAFSLESYSEVHSYDIQHPYDAIHQYPNNLSFASNRIKDTWHTELVSHLPKFEKLVLHINYGGLGDNLFLSHLPRIAKETEAYKKVFISNHSVFRHPDYKKLIWESHPFVDGFTDEMGYYIEYYEAFESMNLFDYVMLKHGLNDGKLFHEPELFCKIEKKPELMGKIIYDPNYISDVAKINKERIDNYFKRNGIVIDFQMQKRDKSFTTDCFNEWIQSESLTDFFSIIASCKEVYCLTSGTATLAPALGTKAHVFYSENYNETFLHSKINSYIKLTE